MEGASINGETANVMISGGAANVMADGGTKTGGHATGVSRSSVVKR